MQIDAVLHTVSLGLIILGMLLIAPKFFSVGESNEALHHHRFGYVLSWFCILAGLIIEVICIWSR